MSSFLDYKAFFESSEASINWQELEAILEKRKNAPLKNPQIIKSYEIALHNAPELQHGANDFSSAIVKIGNEKLADEKKLAILKESLMTFAPWKKGPFDIYGIKIDGEWRSDLKWSRIESSIGSLKDMCVADIGCHNGYYMFRMAAHKPKLVLGVEPYLKHAFTFKLLQKYAKAEELCFEAMGAEDFHVFKQVFDRIFCLGILYHHKDPISLLEILHRSLKRNGKIIVDCQTIPGKQPLALVPRNRYAGACSVWFVPTKTALSHWMIRAGFKKVHVIYDEELSTEEQRATSWANIKSLSDFIDPKDPSLTIEGYPRPRRTYLIGEKN